MSVAAPAVPQFPTDHNAPPLVRFFSNRELGLHEWPTTPPVLLECERYHPPQASDQRRSPPIRRPPPHPPGVARPITGATLRRPLSTSQCTGRPQVTWSWLGSSAPDERFRQPPCAEAAPQKAWTERTDRTHGQNAWSLWVSQHSFIYLAY